MTIPNLLLILALLLIAFSASGCTTAYDYEPHYYANTGGCTNNICSLPVEVVGPFPDAPPNPNGDGLGNMDRYFSIKLPN